MQFNTYLTDSNQLDSLQKANLQEVILEHQDLSRLGRVDTESLLDLLNQALNRGLSPVLQWDILSTESDFQKCVELLEKIPLHQFSAIRIQDSGAAFVLKEKYPEIPVHWIAETGNHNLVGLQRWVDFFGTQLSRLVLSSELTVKHLKEYSAKMDVPFEILAVGRILLFYTPRSLLSFHEQEAVHSSPFLEKILVPDEQPKHRFPSIENKHGTFMFHHKDLFLLDLMEDLQASQMDFLRLDLRHFSSPEIIKDLVQLQDHFEKSEADRIKAEWPVKITHGFFKANRTDLAIKRLKNPHLQDHGENLVAHVVEAMKGDHLILFARQEFKQGESLIGITPEGRKCTISTRILRNTNGENSDKASKGRLYKVNHVKFVTAQTLVYRQSE